MGTTAFQAGDGLALGKNLSVLANEPKEVIVPKHAIIKSNY